MGQVLERRVKGDFDLEMLADRCGTVQNTSVCKLVRISKKIDEPQGKFNLALFEKIPLDDVIPRPTLIAVTDVGTVPSIIAEQLSQGRKFVFDSVIYVENNDARVLGFI